MHRMFRPEEVVAKGIATEDELRLIDQLVIYRLADGSTLQFVPAGRTRRYAHFPDIRAESTAGQQTSLYS